MPDCKACGSWFAAANKRELLCPICERSLARLAGYAAPVVHGRWMPFHSEAAGDIQYCSACEIGFDAKMDYCPHCGAKMDIKDGGDNDAVD